MLSKILQRIKGTQSEKIKLAGKAPALPFGATRFSAQALAGNQLKRGARQLPFVGLDPAHAPFSGARLFYYFMFALLFFSLYLIYLLMQPFLNTIIVSCIIAPIIHPIYSKLLPVTRNNSYIASGITIFLLLTIVVLPLVFFLLQLIPQASRSIFELTQWLESNHLNVLIKDKVSPLIDTINSQQDLITVDVNDIRENLRSFSSKAGEYILNSGKNVFVNSVNLIIQFMLCLLIIFFLLTDGESMVEKVKHFSPLREDQEDNIIHNLRGMAKSVLAGGFMVAALQGLVGGIGLAIVGIPALFWGTVMAFAALVPVIGTGLVWLPAVTYLFLSNQTNDAIFLMLWCGVLVTSIDSIIRPIIVRGSLNIPLLFLFMSIFGGIKAFGMLGLVYGPLILSFAIVMLGIYSDEYNDSLVSPHPKPHKSPVKLKRRALNYGKLKRSRYISNSDTTED